MLKMLNKFDVVSILGGGENFLNDPFANGNPIDSSMMHIINSQLIHSDAKNNPLIFQAFYTFSFIMSKFWNETANEMNETQSKWNECAEQQSMNEPVELQFEYCFLLVAVAR